MTPQFWTRRRAEHFDARLQGELRGREIDRETAELLELVGALRSVPEVSARPEFVAELRGQLMLAAETELVAAPARGRDDVARLTVTPARTRRERRVGVALGAVAILGATTSMAVASQGAIPGDALYPLKRAIENTQAGFTVGDDAKGETLLGNASGRLDEVSELTRQDNPDPQLVTQTLDTFADQATEAGDLLLADYEQHGNEGSIRELQQFTGQSVQELSGLEAVVPATARDALLHAAQVVFALDSAASQLCPACGEPLTELPPQLMAGTTAGLPGPTQTEAGGQLPGATDADDSRGQNGGKGEGRPSGLNPPASPVSVPTGLPSTTGDTGSEVDDLVPSDPASEENGGKGKGGKGKGGKGKPVDLSPVTDTVDNVVTGVVEGVNGLINGLSGTSGK